MGINATTGTVSTIFPGEASPSNSTEVTQGVIFFDTNGEEEPNVKGKDQFILPIDNSGIKYGT